MKKEPPQANQNSVNEVSLSEKYTLFQELLRGYGKIMVAFSGGVDSTFVLKAACDTLGLDNVIAVTADSPSVTRKSIQQTQELAIEFGVKHIFIKTDEVDKNSYKANPANRCFYCKTTLYEHMSPLLNENNFETVINGTNADDMSDYRPGLQAANDFQVKSPAAEAGLTKADIRELSRGMNLSTSDQPASPCLSSRVQYGEEITPEKLFMIEQAEEFLHDMGMTLCRVRHHNNIARIEIPATHFDLLVQTETAEKIHQRFRDIGYQFVTLDLAGFRSGSLNEVVASGQFQPLQINIE